MGSNATTGLHDYARPYRSEIRLRPWEELLIAVVAVYILGAWIALSFVTIGRVQAATGVYHVAGNYPRDLYGPQDTRVGTWGNADSDELVIAFSPPPGEHTRVLRISGNVTASPSLPAGGNIETGSAGFLVGFHRTDWNGSKLCNYCADGCPVYYQGVLSSRVDAAAVPFDVQVGEEDGYLPDDRLVVKLASFLNTTGAPVHLEATYAIDFRWQ